MPALPQTFDNPAAMFALAAIDGQLLAISEAGLREVTLALMSKEAPPLRASYTSSKVGGVAVIPVQGPLSTKNSWLAQLFGASNYEAIAHDLQVALSDEEVSAIVFDIDSPGGDTTGCAELSKLIYEARDRKPMVAYVSGGMCSAAYWIGSAAHEIVANPASILGSIGVRTMMVDVSKALEAAGIARYDIVSDQSPHKVLDAAKPADRERATAMVTQLADVFVADVSRNRNVTQAKVTRDFGKGDVLVGKAAVTAGLADRLGEFDDLISEMNARPAKSALAATSHTKEGDHMAISATPAEAPQASVKSGKCSGCRSSMKSEDPMYCKQCIDGDDDEDDDEESKKAKAFTATVCALLGEPDHAAATQVILKLKGDAAEVAKLKALVVDEKKAREAVELKAILDAGAVAGKVTPAGRIEMEKLAADVGLDAVKRFLAVAPVAPVAAEPPKSDAPPAPENPAATPPALKAHGDLKSILAATGLTPEKFEEAKKRRASATAAYFNKEGE